MSETKAIVKRRQPEIVFVGQGRNQRQQLSTLQFNVPKVAEHILDKGDRWLTVKDLARFAYGTAAQVNQYRVRRQMSRVFNHLLGSHGRILVYEKCGQSIMAVKIFDASSEEDRQHAREKIESMYKRRQLTQHLYETALSILAAA